VELDIYIKRLSRESGVSEMAIYEESGIERSAQKAAEYSAKNSRYTNAVMESPSRMPDSRHMEGRRDNAVRDAESYLLLLALSDADFATELRGQTGEESYGGERREIASQVLGEGLKPSAAELMLRLSDAAQAELARMQTLHLPEEQKDRTKIFADCLKTLEARDMAKRIEELRVELGELGMKDEEKDSRNKELTELMKKLSDRKNKR
jgi:hypothetical protein